MWTSTLTSAISVLLGDRFWHFIYLIVLIAPVTLAIMIVPLLIITLIRGLRTLSERHRAIARWTQPLGMYVSVSVLVYFMLYQWFPHS